MATLIFKIKASTNSSTIQLIICILGDTIFIAVLAAKINDYNNFNYLAEDIPDSVNSKWFTDGWVTITLEFMFVFCYLLGTLLTPFKKL